MTRPTPHTTGRLLSMAGPYGEFQLVTTSQNVVLDIQSQTFDAEGYPHRHSALTHLSLKDARRLRDLLAEAIVAAEDADPHQPGLWSEATTRAVAGCTGRGRLS